MQSHGNSSRTLPLLAKARRSCDRSPSRSFLDELIEESLFTAFPGCDIMRIMRYMQEEQREHLFVNMTEAYTKYRKVVAEWMIDVCTHFNLHPTTTHAAIAYLDRLQPNESFHRYEWQMLAICCILIACKYNETEEHIPHLAELEIITQQAITNESVLNYELWALKRMGWKLNARTPMSFISSSVVGGVLCADDTSPLFDSMYELEVAIAENAFFLAQHCLLDLEYKPFFASDVAGAIHYYLRDALAVSPVWNDEMSRRTLFDPRHGSGERILALLYDTFPIPHENRVTKDGKLVSQVSEDEDDVEIDSRHYKGASQLRTPMFSRNSGSGESEKDTKTPQMDPTGASPSKKLKHKSPVSIAIDEEGDEEGAPEADIAAEKKALTNAYMISRV